MTEQLPRPASVEAHYLAAILDEMHRLTLAVERIDRRVKARADAQDDDDEE